MIKFLVALLLIGVVLSVDNLVNLQVEDGRTPYISVDAFTFGGSSYTIMFQAEFDSMAGPPKTIVWAQGQNVQPAEDNNLVVVQLVGNNKLRLCFGPSQNMRDVDIQTLSVNTLYSFAIVVDDAGSKINIDISINGASITAQIPGVIAQGVRTATLGAKNHYLDGSKSEYMNGLLDNFVIFNAVATSQTIASLHTPHNNWSPSTTAMSNVALWIHFDDAILALDNTAVAITKNVDGANDWVLAKIYGGGSFLSHGAGSVGAENWKSCRSTGDPHYYTFSGSHVGGGEKLSGHRIFQTCDNDDLEIRTHTRMVIWWANTVFRIASFRYKDYVWRVNLDETNGNSDTRGGYTNIALGVPAGRYMRNVRDPESQWQALGDSTMLHEPTGVRYQGWSGKMRLSVPDVATFEVHPNGRYMNLYLTMNLARCTERRGSCDGQLYNEGNVFFTDLIAPPPLPDQPVPEEDPCTNVDEALLTKMETACARQFSNTELYLDCRFDACASGDPHMIPDSDLTPECQLERLSGIESDNCNINKCQGNCFNQGDCVAEECVCDSGFGGFDCYQPDEYTCHTSTYGVIDMNIEPRDILLSHKFDDRFTDYSVFQSLLIYPATFQGKEYMQFIANSPESNQEGSFTVCIKLVNGAAPNTGITILEQPTDGTSVNGPIVVVETSTDFNSPEGKCVDIEFSTYSVGGFYYEIDNTSPAEFLITISADTNLRQVLVGSQNGRGGLDVSKIPKSYLSTGFTWKIEKCNNDECSQFDQMCSECYSTEGCGFCQETQRCMSGTQASPRRGTCKNWRFDLGTDVSRVVTTKYNGDDLVDPDYQVYLSQVDNGVPVSILVPTGRTNNNIDVKFMFSTKGSYSLNAQALKNNLLTTLFGVSNAMNLGLGYYGDARPISTLDLTVVDTKNHYLFGRALQAPPGTNGGNTGGQFAALVEAIVQTSFRQHSRRLAVFTVYDIDSDVNGLAAARAAVLNSDVFPVWAIPRSVEQNVVDFYTDLNNRLDGIPSLVVRIDDTGSDFQAAFRTLFTLSASYPHVVITDITDNDYNHVNLDVMETESDALNIAGLTNTQFRARFYIPMKHSDTDVEHHIAKINIPGFGHSVIEDVATIVPIVTGDRSFSGEENQKCIEVTLAAETFNNLASPIFEITSLPAVGTLYTYDASKPSNIGELVEIAYYAEKTFCFVPQPYDHSVPGSAVYDDFTYTATDGCISSDEATVNIFVTPKYFAPVTEDVYEELLETAQVDPHYFSVVAFEADKKDSGDLEQVSFTYKGFSVDYRSDIHGPAPVDVFNSESINTGTLAFNTAYGPAPVDSLTFEVSHDLGYFNPNEHFFGTIQAKVDLVDDGNANSGVTTAAIKVVVIPVNDAPTAHVVADSVFDATGANQWVMEDNITKIYIIAEDIDNFAIGVNLRIVNLLDTGSSPSVGGQTLTDNWLNDACVSEPSSGKVICEIEYAPSTNYNSCDPSGTGAKIARPTLTEVNGCTPAFTLEYVADDHNTLWGDELSNIAPAQSVLKTLDVHVIAVNDPPQAPPNQFVDLLEDQSDSDVVITVTDIDSVSEEIDLFIGDVCPDFITLKQQSGTVLVGGEEIEDVTQKRNFQDHKFIASTLQDIHGTDRNNNWEVCRVVTTARDQNLASLTNGFVSIRIKPINDAPYDLLTSFTKPEDYNDENNKIDLTAADVDNNLSDLTYVVTQLPYYDMATGEGVVLHVVDPVTGVVEDNVFLTQEDLPYTVQLNGDNKALLYVKNLANWYGVLNNVEYDTLVYTVTDIDAYLEDGVDDEYVVNTVTSVVEIIIPPVNDRPIATVKPPAGLEDTVQVVFLRGESDTWGEGTDELDTHLRESQIVYSSSYTERPAVFFVYDDDWYARYLIDPASVSVSELTELTTSIAVTDELYRIFFIPPQHMNKAADADETPLFIAPYIKYEMRETLSGSYPHNLVSAISDWLVITVNAVNDVPVTWGGEWNVDSAYDNFYGGNDWTYHSGHGEDATTYDNTQCYDNCFYTEDFGFEELVEINPREILFGGRDIEGDDLEVIIRSADCQAPGVESPRLATWELITESTTRVPITTEALVGKTLGKLVKRYTGGEGYKLTSMLAFAPAANDWNTLASSESSHNKDTSGAVSDYYCRLTYAVVDAEGLASDDAELGATPKEILINVRQRNDQPTDSVLENPQERAVQTGYEETNLYLRFDATDVESDDFDFEITACDNSRGSFYFPSAAQKNYILADGSLDESNWESAFDLTAEVNCDSITNPEMQYSATEAKGWYLLFVPGEDDFGSDFSSISCTYNDNTRTGQAPRSTDRFINIRPVNDAPIILSGGDPASELSNIVVGRDQPLALALSFVDVDAVTSDGFEFDKLAFQMRVVPIEFRSNSVEYDTAKGEPYTYVAESTTSGVRDVFIVQPQDEDQPGFIRWRGSISQANTFVASTSIVFKERGDYEIEIVALDSGRTGYCPEGLTADTEEYEPEDIRELYGKEGELRGSIGYENTRCNRVSVVTIDIKVSNTDRATGAIVTGAGAGLLALLALGAVLFAKLKKPEDLDAWQALDNAQFANAQQSAIHKEGKMGGKNELYEGN